MSGVSSRPSLLLPFGLEEERRAFITYSQSILPGSKRFVTEHDFAGTNADVRPPGPGEMWKGGGFGSGGGGGGFVQRYPIVSTVLHLDAVFFADGEFVGADAAHLWDEVVVRSEVCRDLARVVRTRGVEAIRELAASAYPHRPPPPPPPPLYRQTEDVRAHEMHHLARRIKWMCAGHGEEKAAALIAEWADTPLPDYRRR